MFESSVVHQKKDGNGILYWQQIDFQSLKAAEVLVQEIIFWQELAFAINIFIN